MEELLWLQESPPIHSVKTLKQHIMTAIVGILNKRGIAIAADSVATITNCKGRKVLNSETKIFRLSKKYPISVMIYGSANFMSTPWDLIVKLYCSKRGNKSRNSVKEYVDDFIDFLGDEDYFCNKEIQEYTYRHQLIDFYLSVRDSAKSKFEKEENEKEEEEEINTYETFFMDELTEVEKFCKGMEEKCPELSDYSFKSFISDAKEHIDYIIEEGFKDEGFNLTLRELFEHAAYEWFKSTVFVGRSSGLVFCGYGENDIFPCIYPIEVAGAFNNRLRYFVNERRIYQVSHEDSAAICPYAQADVMQTFMDGISPDFREKIENANKTVIDQVYSDIYKKLADAGVNEEVLKLVEEVNTDEMKDKFENELSAYIQDEKDEGLLSAVDGFNMQELASMAESLVSITNLQRHFTSSEESVGGPVDVAVITRHEGFIWVKRKMWFDSQLNRHVISEE